MLTQQWRHAARSMTMLVVGLTLGLLFSLVWGPHPDANVAEIGPDPARIWLSIDRLDAEQRELKSALAQLRQELGERQQAAAANTDRLQALRVELERQRLLAGLTPVRGPGVLVTLDDSDAPISFGADPNSYIIHEYDLRDIVNLLWMAGSEAISINDERLVSNSSIYCLGSTVMVNDTRLSPPYFIRAVGNPRIQQDYLRNPSYLQELKAKQRLYELRFDVASLANLTLPGYTGSFLIHQARPGK